MTRLALLALVPSLGVACGSSGGPGDSFVTCDTDMRAAPYQPGMSFTSTSGKFVVKLLESTPGPPVKGNNTWTIEVDDSASGMALEGLDITVTPFMPDHGHYSTIVMATAAEAGTYTLHPVYLFMPGVWEVRMDIAGAATAGDSAILPTCIP